MTGIKYYHGIVDKYGIDWFRKFDGQMLRMAEVRARANMQRGSKTFLCSIKEQTEKEIKTLIRRLKHNEAKRKLMREAVYLDLRDKKDYKKEQVFLIGLHEYYKKLEFTRRL